MDLRTTVSPLLLLLLGLCNAHRGYGHDSDNESLADKSEMEDMTTAILRMNNGSREFLLEGDVLIPKIRTAMNCFHKAYSCLWPKSANGNVEIPFYLSQKYDDTERNVILKAMKDIESNTCIRFISRTAQRVHLSIEPRHGCFSLLGRTGDRQILSLQRFGCVRHGIVQHELLHTLGFYHEHTRNDRDQYVEINWENIIDYYVSNFDKKDTNNLDTAYDYSSVMHYGKTAFGKARSNTIIPIPNSSVPIGQREGLSNTDIIRINRLYKCSDYNQ